MFGLCPTSVVREASTSWQQSRLGSSRGTEDFEQYVTRLASQCSASEHHFF
jgi:hypothetical protein